MKLYNVFYLAFTNFELKRTYICIEILKYCRPIKILKSVGYAIGS